MVLEDRHVDGMTRTGLGWLLAARLLLAARNQRHIVRERSAWRALSMRGLAYAVAGTLAWVAVSYMWARRQFVRFIVRAAGA